MKFQGGKAAGLVLYVKAKENRLSGIRKNMFHHDPLCLKAAQDVSCKGETYLWEFRFQVLAATTSLQPWLSTSQLWRCSSTLGLGRALKKTTNSPALIRGSADCAEVERSH